jgi:uncharacterized protein YoaH (UPF0181 family)
LKNNHVGFEILTEMIKSMVFWVVLLCNSEKAQHSTGAYHLQLHGQQLLVSCLAYSSTLMVEEISSSETLDITALQLRRPHSSKKSLSHLKYNDIMLYPNQGKWLCGKKQLFI